jgi:predicted membrane metal-binding protein
MRYSPIMTYLLSNNFHLFPISPLFIFTCFFIVGIIWHTLLPYFLLCFVVLLCYSLYSYIKQHHFYPTILLCCMCVCMSAFLYQQNIHDYHAFYNFTANKKITVTGTIVDSYNTTHHYKKVTAITLALDTIATALHTKASNKYMLLYSKNNNNASVGDHVTFYNITCKKPSNESFQHYQIKEHIVATVFDCATQCTINYHPTWSLRYWIWNIKNRLFYTLQSKLSPHTFTFFSSLFLGNRTYIHQSLDETNEQFKKWGMSHFLARSGLHLVLFIFIWQAIFCFIPLPFLFKQIIITLLSCIYFILTWTSAPFTRSFALFILNKYCFYSKAPFHLFHYLTLVCLSFLLYCPLYLFFLDFQLSFVLTFALAWFNQLSAHQKAE